MNHRQIEARTAFPSAGDLMARLFATNNLNDLAREKFIKEGGETTVVAEVAAPKVLGELKTNGAPIPGPTTQQKV